LKGGKLIMRIICGLKKIKKKNGTTGSTGCRHMGLGRGQSLEIKMLAGLRTGKKSRAQKLHTKNKVGIGTGVQAFRSSSNRG